MGDWVQRNGDRNRSFLSRVWSSIEMLDHPSLDDGNIDSMLVVPPCRTPIASVNMVEEATITKVVDSSDGDGRVGKKRFLSNRCRVHWCLRKA